MSLISAEKNARRRKFWYLIVNKTFTLLENVGIFVSVCACATMSFIEGEVCTTICSTPKKTTMENIKARMRSISSHQQVSFLCSNFFCSAKIYNQLRHHHTVYFFCVLTLFDFRLNIKMPTIYTSIKLNFSLQRRREARERRDILPKTKTQ